MSKLILNDNLKAYHAELAEHIKLLQRNTAYVLDDIVNYDGITLKCTTAGTTNIIKPSISSLAVGSTYTDGTCVWTRIDPDKRGIDYWAASTTYALNDQVVYNDKIYKCSTAHTSTSTFDDTKWTEISVSSSGGGLDYWATSTSYSVDDIVVYNNQIWRCTTAHTSSSTFDSTKFTEISASGAGGISVWASNTQYAVNDVVIDSNLIWQCATAHTSTATFDESKWVCISGGEISSGLEIVPLWEGTFNFSNSTQGATPTSSTPMMELSEPISNFEYILVCGELSDLSNVDSVIVPISAINPPSTIRFSIVLDNSDYYSASINQYDSTHLYIAWKVETYSQARITKIQGIRKAKPIVSSGMKYETLWEGEAGSLSSDYNTNLQLSTTINKYSKLGFELKTCNPANTNDIKIYYQECSVSQIISLINGGSGDILFTSGYGTWVNNFNIYSTSTPSNLVVGLSKTLITKIIGISEGVQIPTGVQAARVTLWEGNGGNLNSDFTTSIQLSDAISKYSKLGLELKTRNPNNSNDIKTYYQECSTSQILSIISNNSGQVNFTLGYGTWTNNLNILSSSTMSNLSIEGGMTVVTKIVGIKYIQPDSYSTEEKLIGTWIDGKPLYRKVFENVSNGLNLGLPSSQFSVKRIYGGSVAGDNSVFPLPNETNSIAILSSGYFDTNRSGSIDWIAVEYTKN